jgi:hypothetical protein
MVVRGVGVSGGDLDVAQVDAGVEHRGDEGVPQHVRVQPRHPHPRGLGQPSQPAGGGVPVHPRPAAGAQDRPHRPVVDREIDGPSDRGWEGDEDDLAALPDDAQDAVAVLLPQIGHVGSAGLEHPQAVPGDSILRDVTQFVTEPTTRQSRHGDRSSNLTRPPVGPSSVEPDWSTRVPTCGAGWWRRVRFAVRRRSAR